jgi:hypothetical protein
MPNPASDDDAPVELTGVESPDERRRATLLDTSDNILAKCVAPAMPWLFLALRRALIPTVCLLILVVLFFAIPETSEVLLGLTEPVSQHVSADSSTSSLNGAPLTWYLVWSVLLSLGIWYSARLLCTVEAWLGMPLVWEIRELGPHWPSESTHSDPRKHLNEIRVKTAIQRMPRVYAVSALVLTMGSLVLATLFLMPRIWALVLVASLLAGPLIVACGVLNLHARASKWSIIAIGSVMYVVSAVVLAVNFKAEAHQSVAAVVTLDVLCALVPAIVLMGLVWRRPVMRRIYTKWFKRSDKTFSYDVFESHHALRFEDVFWQVLTFVLIGAALLVLLANLHAKYVRSIGSVGTIMLFLAAAVVAISGCQLFLRRISRAVPGFTSAVAIIAMLVLQFFSHERLGNESIGKATHGGRVVEDPVVPAHTLVKPRLLVNAYGGGLRAAIFTAQVLALADDASCGEFGQHLHAMSGVSGGSLGIAVYLIARQTLASKHIWDDCSTPPVGTPLTDVVTKALVQDHLSPVIATALSIDVFLRTPLTPGAHAKRGQSMLDSWNDALVEALEPHDINSDSKDWNLPLGLPLVELNGGLSPAPRVIFNATDADSGSGMWFSNGAGGLRLSNFTRESNPDPRMTVGQAVLHSARFPYATPAGTYSEGGKAFRLVDGGYADNSGARTLYAQVLAKAKDDYPNVGDLVLLDIDGNPPEPSASDIAKQCHKSKGDTESSIPTALLALLQARAARAKDAVNELANGLPGCKSLSCLSPVQISAAPSQAQTQPNGRHDDPACDQIENERTIPLGWYTGPGTSQLMAVSSKAKVQQVCKLAHVECKELR